MEGPEKDDEFSAEGEAIDLDDLVSSGAEEDEVGEDSVSPDERSKQTAKAQQDISRWLMIAFCLSLALILTAWIFGKSTDEAAKMAAIILPTITGLLGSVIGFYFGTQDYRRES